MLYVNNNSINDVVMTLNEKVTITGLTPTFLVELEDKNTQENIYFNFGPDLSNCELRSNVFELTLTASTATTIDYNNAIISLNGGWYEYNVYEATGATLDISGTTGVILETGKIFVKNENTDIIHNVIIIDKKEYNAF